MCLVLGGISVLIPLLYGVNPWTGVVFTIIAYWTYVLSQRERTYRTAAIILVTLLTLSSVLYAVVHGIYGALGFFLLLLSGIVASLTVSQQVGILLFVGEGIVMVPLAVYQHRVHQVFDTASVLPDTLMAVLIATAVYFIIRLFSSHLTQLQGRERAHLKELAVYNTQIESVLQTRLEELENQIKERTNRMRLLAHRGKELSHITHDLSNTLTSLRLTLDQGIQNLPEQERATVEDSFNHIRTILQSAQRGGKGRVKHCSITSVVTSSVQMLEKRLKRAEIGVALDLEEAQIAITPAHLQRIIDNLLQNSYDALLGAKKRSKRQIRISGNREGGEYIFSFYDTGTGIPEDLLPLVTEPWFSTKGDSHIGMGLSSVTELLRLYPKTDFQLDSKHQSYTKITLTLPLWRAGKA